MDVSVINAFGQLWKRLYNPNNGCPDVCLDDILTEMTNIVAKDLSASEWVLAYISIINNSGMDADQSWLEMSWANVMVPCISPYLIKDGKYKAKDNKIFAREIKKEDAAKIKAMTKMRKIINKLVDSGELELVNGKLRRGSNE